MEIVKQLRFATRLSYRSILGISGVDRLAFLQGLISNDVSKASATQAVYAALLTPQGKFLHDLFILDHDNAYLIDCESARAEDLIHRLSAYKLRSKVTFENLTDAYDVWATWDDASSPDARRKAGAPPSPLMGEGRDGGAAATTLSTPPVYLSFPDPRLPDLGTRAFAPKGRVPENIQPANPAAYDAHRLSLGIADGSRDLETEKSTLAEGNFDLLNGIDWKKGCYVGQELTARMHYRGLAKKRLFPVRIEGESPPYGSILSDDSGEMRSTCGQYGLALLRIDAVSQEKPLTYRETMLWPFLPAWMKIDVKAGNS